MKWSFSKIDTFTQCKRKFKNVYLDSRAGEIKSDAMAIGEGMHAFLEKYACNHHLRDDIETCRTLFINGAMNASSLVNPKEPSRHLYLVDSYVANQRPLTPMMIDGKPAVERYFKLDCGEGVVCSGKIDIITDKGNVVDYKTASSFYSSGDIKPVTSGKGLQLSIYAAAYRQWFGTIPNKVGFQVILKSDEKPQNIGITRTGEDLNQTIAYIQYVDSIARKETQWHPSKSKYACKWCSFKTECGM